MNSSMFSGRATTITAAEMFSDSCQHKKVKVNGRPYWKQRAGLWICDDQASPGEYDNAPEVSDPENVGGLL